MSLRVQAERDLGMILSDDVFGFAWDISVTDTTGTVYPFKGFSNDIAQMLDPDTGLLVSGRVASVALRIADFEALGIGLPRRVSDESLQPWIVTFNDINANSFDFIIRQSDPDRALGMIVLLLEAYTR